MFEQFQKPGGYEPRWIGARLFAVGAVGVLLSLGLCRVGTIGSGSENVSMLGFYLLLASALIFLAAILVTIVELIVVAVRNGWARSREGDD